MDDVRNESINLAQSYSDCRFRYVIVTPARNEESNIERTLESMVHQTVRPRCWVIVNDGSTDRTGAIINQYSQRYDFIVHITAEGGGKACFGSKVKAFHAGHAQLTGVDYDYIGNVDGDVSFVPEYFETLLERMEKQESLGLAGGIVLEQVGDRFVPQSISANSVAGAVQCFRRRCYEEIGGYRPVEIGGIDSVAEIMARMHGWDVNTFADLGVCHHGRVTTGARSILATRFKKGRINYALGYHPMFQLCIGTLRTVQPPYIVGGLLMVAGYAWAAIRQENRCISPAAIQFLRKEQVNRLRGLFGGRKGAVTVPRENSSQRVSNDVER